MQPEVLLNFYIARSLHDYSHSTRSKWLLPYLVRFSINIIYVSWCFLLNPYFYE